jgi:hypothetical protein
MRADTIFGKLGQKQSATAAGFLGMFLINQSTQSSIRHRLPVPWTAA